VTYSWRVKYIAALAEKDPERQRQLVYQAVAAIEQRRQSLSKPDSEESGAIDQADKALKTLRRSLSEGRRRSGNSV
jgi:hypothetical protein